MSITTERSTLLTSARALVDRAKAAGRELSPTEQAEVETAIAKVHDLDARAKSVSLVDRVLALGPVDPEAPTGLFDDHTNAAFTAAIRNKTAFRASVDREGLLTKAGPILSGSLVPPSSDGVSGPLYPNGTVSLADLMPTVAVSGPSVRYYTVSAGVAGVVAEGAVKPDSNIAATAVDVTLTKIAALLKISDEATEDAPWLLQHLSRALVGAVISKENEEIIATIGAASGILTKTGADTDIIDLVAQAIAGMQSVGTNPTAVLVNPTTLSVIRQAKAQTSGVYLAVDPLAAGPTTLHGLPVYPVNVTGANTSYVLDGTGLTYFRRSAVTFELGHDSDDYARNLQTGRAETRGKCGVLQPLAVTKVTLTTTP